MGISLDTELALMAEACAISAQAFGDAMAYSHPGVCEHVLDSVGSFYMLSCYRLSFVWSNRTLVADDLYLTIGLMS